MLAVVVLAMSVPARAQPAAASPAESPARRHKAQQLFELGRKQFNLGKFKIALGNFTKAYDLLPLSGFLFNIAQCHRFLDNCKKAVFLYRGYLRDNPGSPNTDVVKGLVVRCEKKLEEQRRRRGRAGALYQEGVTLYKLGKFKEAAERYASAFKIVPLPGFLFALGQAHHKLRSYKQAIHFYEMYLRDNPGTPKTRAIRQRIAECRTKLVAELRKLPGSVVGGPGIPGGNGDRKARTPVYKKWWFWTVIGVGVAALVGGLAGGLAGRDAPRLSLPESTYGVRDWR